VSHASFGIRHLRAEDRGEWLRLLRGLYPGEPDGEHTPAMDAFLAGAPGDTLLPAAVLVAERPGGGLGGFLELSVREYAEGCAGATPYVESWYVDPDLRGRGVGAALVAAAERWARERGHREMASDALLENVASQAAHRALGFEEVERAVHFRKRLEEG
jgi:aminoglycoside 6'-N-acetyltransferase I